MQRLRSLIQQQHDELDALSAEVQRKGITEDRVVRLMKIVQRNVEISERIVSLLSRAAVVNETSEEIANGFRTRLT